MVKELRFRLNSPRRSHGYLASTLAQIHLARMTAIKSHTHFVDSIVVLKPEPVCPLGG